MGTEGFFSGKKRENKSLKAVSQGDTSKRAFDGSPSIYDTKVPIRPSQNGPSPVLEKVLVKTRKEQQVPAGEEKTEEAVKGELNKERADEFAKKRLQEYTARKNARETKKKSDQGAGANFVAQKGNLEQQDKIVEGRIEQPHVEFQSEVGFGLADVDEFETSAVLPGEKKYAEEDVAEALENERKIGQIFGREKEEIRQDAEHDLKVRWFEKEAYDYPERSDEVWNRFIVANPIEALLYRDHNPGIRSALERKEAKRVSVAKQEAVHVSEEVPMTLKQGMVEIAVELEKQRVAKPKPQEQKFFDSRFKTEFGITEEQISQIEGYERLSEGQQKLVLENLQEYARDARGGITARTWEGILKAVGRDTKDKNYINAATVLIRNTAQFGPKVHEENGELLVDLVGDVKFNREHRVEEKAVVDRFNARAHEYAKIKVSNFEENTGTKRKSESKIVSIFKNIFSGSRQEFDTTEHLYENSKQELVKVLSAQGMSEGQIAERLIQIDSKVHVLRFLQTELEAVDVIKQSTEQSFFQKIGKKFLTNTPYALLGFVGRFATAETMGFFASPAVAGVIGGIRSWDKTSAELRERDRAVRMGEGRINPKVQELQKKIKGVILERNTLNPSSSMNDRVRDIELRQWLDRYNADLVSMGTELNIVDATREIKVGQDGKKDVGLTQKLRDLIHEYQIETVNDSVTDDEKTKALERISARVAYVEDKLNLNRINFGSGTERSLHMANLFETLGEAKILLADAEMPKRSRLEARLEQYLIKREGLIQTRRRMKQIKIAAKDTLIAGSFATAGALLSDYVFSHGLFNKETSIASGVAGSSKAPSLVDAGTSPQARAEYESGTGQGAESSKLGSLVQETQSRGGVPESAPEIQKSAPYTIKAGDTLTKILKEQAPSIKELGNTQAQENAVANILRSLTPVEMDSIGLSSHNIGNIRVDDSIDVQKLNAIIAEKQSIIESAQNRFEDESVRSYTEASPRSGSQQGEILKNAGVSPKAGEAITSGKEASDIVLGQQVEDSSLRSEEAPPAEAQPKSPIPEEGLPEKPSTGTEPVASDVGTSQNSSLESAPQQDLSEYESLRDSFGIEDEVDTVVPDQPQQTIEGVTINKHRVPIDETRPNVYKVKTIGGKEILISHGGGDLKSRVDEAYKYAEENPGTTVYVEGLSKLKLFSPNQPPPMIAVTAPTGVVKDVDLNIMSFKMDRTFTGDIDIDSFTERLTKR